jgi:hypothetical protein
MKRDNYNVLLSLLKNPGIVEKRQSTFQWVVNTSSIPNRNRCRATLNELKKQKLMREEPEIKNWKIGQKKWFSLTEKGRNKGLKLVVDEINQGLSILESLTSTLDPVKIRKDIDLEIDSLWELMLNDERPFEEKSFSEKVEYFNRRQSETARPLFESLRRLHKILTNFRTGEVDYSQYITVVRGNGSDPLTIPLRLLKGIDFVGLFFLSQSRNQELEAKWNAKFTSAVSS